MMEPHWTSSCGRFRLWNADCRDVLPLFDSGSVDAVVTSPPYNCGKDYGTASDERELTEYWAWIEDVFSRATRVLARHGYLCVNHGNYIGSRTSRSFVPDELKAILERCLPFRDWIIWDKGPVNGAAWGNFRNAPRIRAQHENIFVHGGVVKMPDSDIGWDEWSQFTTSIWRIPTAGVDLSLHPAMMPVEVARRLCLLYSPADGTVCDPFSGSGTTALACIATGRRFVGMEIDPEHFALAVRRISHSLGMEVADRHGVTQRRLFTADTG